MKSSHLITLGIGSVVITTGIYLNSSDAPIDTTGEISQNNTPAASSVVQKKQKDMWEILSDATARADNTSKDIPSDRDRLIEFMNNNPTLRLRIQNTSWYRDFLSGKLTVQDIAKNIEDAIDIEEILISKPTILSQIQYSGVWHKYLSGDVPPHNILYGEIPAMQQIDESRKKNPDILSQIERGPMFQKTSSGEELAYTEQKSIFEGMLAQSKILQDNPNIRTRFEQYGYSEASIYKGDWRDGQQSGFFAVNDAIYTLENPSNFYPEVWRQFQESDIGKKYEEGTIGPNEALRYINTLMIHANP